MILKLENVHKKFGDIEILKGVGLEVNKGDVVTILGPSGSGKTTLLRIANFLEQADQGTMQFDDLHLQLGQVSKKQMRTVRMRTGFVFQNYNLFANKTALENVIEGLITARNIPIKKAEDIGKTVLDKVGLADRYNFYPSQLSGGQQQRVGIARAMATEPEVIFLDEPTSALDPELIGEVLNVIKKLAMEGTTMVIVTHEINFAEMVSNKVYFMENGVVLEKGTPQDIFYNAKEKRTQQFLQHIKR